MMWCDHTPRVTYVHISSCHSFFLNEKLFFSPDCVCMDFFVHLEDWSNVQIINVIIHQLMDPRGEYLENCRCIGGCQKLNRSTKTVFIKQ